MNTETAVQLTKDVSEDILLALETQETPLLCL